MPYPDFLCIGAQKSGTTWLHHQLSLHPEVWLPPVKELHYFDRPQGGRLIHAVFSAKLQGKFVRASFRFLTQKDKASWATRFIFGRRTKRYYQALFRPGAGQISGETTPAYAWLDQQTIAEIQAHMPKVKLIYFLRNPVDRSWSQMNMYRRRSDVDKNLAYSEIFRIKKEMLVRHSSYIKNLDRWSACFDASQMYVGFYEQIKEDPLELLRNVLSFLKVDKDYISEELEHNIGKPINRGNHGEMPIEIELKLSRLLLNELELLHQRFQNQYTEQWLNRANEVINQHQ